MAEFGDTLEALLERAEDELEPAFVEANDHVAALIARYAGDEDTYLWMSQWIAQQVNTEMQIVARKEEETVYRLWWVAIGAALDGLAKPGQPIPGRDMIANYTVQQLLANPFSGTPLSDRIWDTSRRSATAILNEIRRGVLLGSPVGKIAERVSAYLRPAAVGTGESPGQGVYRSGFANAVRLVQSEIVRAAMEAAVVFGNSQEGVLGYEFVANPDACEKCVALAGFYAKDSVPYYPHPNCRCWIRLVYDPTVKLRSAPDAFGDFAKRFYFAARQ